MNPNEKPEPTEGEEMIMDFFDEVGIRYTREKKIDWLKNDSKQFRIADFYLPRFEVYVEFLGRYKNEDNDYATKWEVYKNNRVPCVYLYPDNLGALHFMFDKRVQKVLGYHDKKLLNKYRWFKMYKARMPNLVTWVFGLFLIIISMVLHFNKHSEEIGLFVIGSGIIIYQFYLILKTYRDIFVKKRFSLLKVLNS